MFCKFRTSKIDDLSLFLANKNRCARTSFLIPVVVRTHCYTRLSFHISLKSIVMFFKMNSDILIRVLFKWLCVLWNVLHNDIFLKKFIRNFNFWWHLSDMWNVLKGLQLTYLAFQKLITFNPEAIILPVFLCF